jgi:centromeric protein E
MDSIRVVVRARPLNEREIKANISSVEITGFDEIFYNESNAEIYSLVAKDIINSTLEGFNATIFTYGQTSSGKTFTMTGTKEEPGVIPLSIKDIFEIIEKTTDREFLLRVSYLEIYNEVCISLIQDYKGPTLSRK